MSGGHWNNLSEELENRAKYGGEIWLLMAELEHALDSDPCIDCARVRISYAIETFFNDRANCINKAILVAEDSSQYKCPRCEENK